MTAEATPVLYKTPEQIFRETYSWLTEEELTQNGLVVGRITVPIDGSGWYRNIINIGTRDYKGGRVDSELLVEVVNTHNRRGMPSDSQFVVLNADKAGTTLQLSLALAFGIVSCQKSPGINVHFEKSSVGTLKAVNNFLAQALGLKTIYQVELEHYARSREAKK